jgi:GxxExxY protein
LKNWCGSVLHGLRGMPTEADLNALTWKIIKCAMAVHSALGPGLLESAYQACLLFELQTAGLSVRSRVDVPLVYRGVTLECGYSLDITVDDVVILELKAIEKILPVHEAQLLTYLRLTEKPIGLLLNFNVPHMKDGIRRKILTQRKPDPA